MKRGVSFQKQRCGDRTLRDFSIFKCSLLWSYYLFFFNGEVYFLKGKIGVRLSARIAHSFIKATRLNVGQRSRIS